MVRKVDIQSGHERPPSARPRPLHACAEPLALPPESLADRALGVAITVGLALFALSVPLSIAGAQIGCGVALAGVVVLAARRRLPLRGTPLLVPYLVFVAVGIATVVAAGALRGWSPATAWRNGLAFFAVVLGLRAGRPSQREMRLVLVMVLALLGALVAVGVGVAQVFVPFDPGHALGLKTTPYIVAAPDAPGLNAALGFFNSRLTLGHVLGALFALTLGLLASGALAGGGRVLVVVVSGLLLLGIAATFSRSAYLGSLAAGSAVVLAAGVRRPRAALGIGLALLLAAGVGVALWPGMRERLRSAVDPERNPDRVFVWERAVEMIQDHPVLGVGFGNYPKACAPYYDRVNPSFTMRTWAHNAALTALVEGGPPMLLALLWVFAAALAGALGRVARARPGSVEHGLALGALGALAMAAVAAQFHDLLYDAESVFALSLVLGLGLSPRPEKPRSTWAPPSAWPRSGSSPAR